MRGAKSVIISFVSIIALIGLVATLFAAYNNSLNTHQDSFERFSIQSYADGFTLQSTISSGTYKCRILHKNLRTISYAQIYIDGRWESSINEVNDLITHRSSRVYSFSIGDRVFNTNYNPIEVGDDGEMGWWFVTLPAMVITVDQPDISVVGEAWANVDGLNKSIGNAFSVTGQFIVDSLQFQGRVFLAVLPWNGVTEGSRSYVDSLWIEAQQTVDEWREQMNNGED